jgi:hypothetical protein
VFQLSSSVKQFQPPLAVTIAVSTWADENQGRNVASCDVATRVSHLQTASAKSRLIFEAMGSLEHTKKAANGTSKEGILSKVAVGHLRW